MASDGPIVYIVDDDPQVCESLSLMVRSTGLNVETYLSAEAFLDSFDDTSSAPKCMVLDVRMPGLSGLGLQQTLSARGKRMPIIMVSGCADIPMAVQAMRAGALDFLEKPFNRRALLTAHSGGYRPRRQAAAPDRPLRRVGGPLGNAFRPPARSARFVSGRQALQTDRQHVGHRGEDGRQTPRRHDRKNAGRQHHRTRPLDDRRELAVEWRGLFTAGHPDDFPPLKTTRHRHGKRPAGD